MEDFEFFVGVAAGVITLISFYFAVQLSLFLSVFIAIIITSIPLTFLLIKYFKTNEKFYFIIIQLFLFFLLIGLISIQLFVPIGITATISTPKHLSNVSSPVIIKGSISGQATNELKYLWIYTALEKNGPAYPKSQISYSDDGTWEEKVYFSETDLGKDIWIFIVLLDQDGVKQAKQIRSTYEETRIMPDEQFPDNHKKIREICVRLTEIHESFNPNSSHIDDLNFNQSQIY